MNSFNAEKLVVVSVGSYEWKLYTDLHYKGMKIPKGFITDFASVPRLFWSILPPAGKYSKATVVHDYLYKKNGAVTLFLDYWGPNGSLIDKLYTRKQCDKIFLKAMKELGVKRWKRLVMYYAVRIGGRKAWNDHENQNH